MQTTFINDLPKPNKRLVLWHVELAQRLHSVDCQLRKLQEDFKQLKTKSLKIEELEQRLTTIEIEYELAVGSDTFSEMEERFNTLKEIKN